jgi:hypothetical protein
LDQEASPQGLKRVVAEEKARGSRSRLPDEEVLKKKQEAREDFNYLLKHGSKKEFIRWLKDGYGLESGSEAYRLAVAAWDEEVQKRK